MNILFLASGTYEVQRSVCFSLARQGHNMTYVCADLPNYMNIIEKNFLDISYDLIFTANWRGVTDRAIPINSIVSKDICPIINLGLGDAFYELALLTNFGRVTEFMTKNNLFLWVMSQSNYDILTKMQLPNIIFQHLGITDVIDINAPQEAYRSYNNSYTPQYVTYQELISFRLKNSACNGHHENKVPKALYLGTPKYDFSDIDSEILKIYECFFRQNETPTFPNIEINHNNVGSLIQFYRYSIEAQRQLHALPLRREIIGTLKKVLQDEFHLYGDAWREFGISSFPSKVADRDLMYHTAGVSIDFGSLAYSETLYPRTCEIIKNHGMLLQLRRHDSDEILEELASEVTFTTIEDAIEKTNAYANKSRLRKEIKTAIYNKVSQKYHFENLIHPVISTVINNSQGYQFGYFQKSYLETVSTSQKLFIAQQLFSQEKLTDAEMIYHEILESNPNNEQVRNLLNEAVSLNYFLTMAQNNKEFGNNIHAIEWCNKALQMNPSLSKPYEIMSDISLPGPYYLEVIKNIHNILQPSTYIETGVSNGGSLTLANHHTIAIGVDPVLTHYSKLESPIPQSTKLFAEKSDNFFKKYNLTEELNNKPVELGFIDGMHLFEYALRDFMNIEKHCTKNSVILIHDCYPLNEITSQRERVTGWYSGDVWKLILCLKKYRQDLSINVIATNPTGLGIVQNLDPNSTIIADNLNTLYDEFVPMGYSTLEERKDEMLNLVPNNDETLQRIFNN